MSIWDERYQSADYIFGTEPNDFLRAKESLLPKGSVILCLGEGEGRNAVFLAKQGKSVTAVDMSVTGLSKASRLAESNGVHINTQVANLVNYEFREETWDGIVSIFCHLPSLLRTNVHQRVVKALKPGGVYLLEAYTPAQLKYRTGGPSDPDMLYTLAALRQDLMGLELIHATEIVREVREEAAHHGPAAVVQIVARKPST